MGRQTIEAILFSGVATFAIIGLWVVLRRFGIGNEWPWFERVKLRRKIRREGTQPDWPLRANGHADGYPLLP